MSNTPSSIIVEYGPDVEPPSQGDYVMIEHGDSTIAGKYLTGYLQHYTSPEHMKMLHGPVFKLSQVRKFVRRKGFKLPTGTPALPINSL